MLYLPRFPPDASPKAISESASYLQVCLAFHSQPQLVPALFSGLRFGPPQGFTPASAWPRLDHLASGLPRATGALFGLGFPPAPGLQSPRLATHGNSQAHSTKGTPQRVSPPRPLAGPRFQVLFHSPPGVLFTFPSRYSALSVATECSALEGGPPGFPRDSSCPVVLRLRRHAGAHGFAYGALTHSGRPSQAVPLAAAPARVSPAPALQPRRAEALRFGLLRVRSPLLAESRLISLPAGTQMVHSPAYGPPRPMCSAAGRTPSGVPVTRFGRPRIPASLQLPAAYRSLPRPSSPGGSKASSCGPSIA